MQSKWYLRSCNSRGKVWSIEDYAHDYTSQSASDGNRHDPREEQEANSLPVDCLEGAVAEPNTHGSTGDTHGSRDGKGVLREDENGDGGTHFHGGTSAWRVVRDLVAHNYSRVKSACSFQVNRHIIQNCLPFIIL